MKFLIKRTANADQRTNEQASFEIPNQAITWVTVIYLVLNILSTSLANYLSNKPQREIDENNFTLKEKNQQIQLLQRIMEADSLPDRQLSLQLLLRLNLLQGNPIHKRFKPDF